MLLPIFVMAGLVPAIHNRGIASYSKSRLWIAGTSPAMTKMVCVLAQSEFARGRKTNRFESVKLNNNPTATPIAVAR